MILFKKTNKASTLIAIVFSVLLFINPVMSGAQQLNGPKIDSFILIDTNTGKELAVYSNVDGESFGAVSMADADNISLRISSNASSVRISGVSAQPRIENHRPHSLLGDENGVYEPWSPNVGVHSILVEPFAGFGATGTLGESVTLTFRVTETPIPSVESFTVVNADTGEDIESYANISGNTFASITNTNAQRISLRFNTKNTESVRVTGIDGSRTDNSLPFSLLGDDVDTYTPWTPSLGVHTISIEPFSATGLQGESATLRFTVKSELSQPLSSDFSDLSPAINYLLLGGSISDDGSIGQGGEKQTTVVILGASIVAQAFGGHNLNETNQVMMDKLAENNIDNIDFYTYGLAGSTISSSLGRVDQVLEAFPDAVVIVHLGGNDVTSTRPYATRTQQQVNDFTQDIESLIAKFSGIEDQLILLPLTYRAYANVYVDDSMFLDGSTGSEPFNLYEYLSRIPDDQKNIDGNHILDLYNFTRNNRFTLGSDGIHFNRFGNEYIRQHVADRLGYLINGGERPSVVVPGGPAEPFDPDCCG